MGLKTKVTELDIEMEEAVNMKDFLKAHQIKEKKEKLEESIKKMELDPSSAKDVDTILVAVKETKTDSARAPPKTPNVPVVSTPGSSKNSSANISKKEALEKERQAKKEALEKEKQAKKEALELEKQAKKEALELEKQAKKEAKE